MALFRPARGPLGNILKLTNNTRGPFLLPFQLDNPKPTTFRAVRSKVSFQGANSVARFSTSFQRSNARSRITALSSDTISPKRVPRDFATIFARSTHTEHPFPRYEEDTSGQEEEKSGTSQLSYQTASGRYALVCFLLGVFWRRRLQEPEEEKEKGRLRHKQMHRGWKTAEDVIQDVESDYEVLVRLLEKRFHKRLGELEDKRKSYIEMSGWKKPQERMESLERVLEEEKELLMGEYQSQKEGLEKEKDVTLTWLRSQQQALGRKYEYRTWSWFDDSKTMKIRRS